MVTVHENSSIESKNGNCTPRNIHNSKIVILKKKKKEMIIRRTLFTSGTTLYVDHCRSVEIEDVGIDSSFLEKSR